MARATSLHSIGTAPFTGVSRVLLSGLFVLPLLLYVYSSDTQVLICKTSFLIRLGSFSPWQQSGDEQGWHWEIYRHQLF